MKTIDRLIELLSEERGKPGPNLAEEDKPRYFRALVNMRTPKPASKELLQIQDEYLQEELQRKGITDFADLKPVAPDICLWQGDITTLKCD